MASLLLAYLVAVPLAIHLAAAWYVYNNAAVHDMDQRKWGTVAALVPFFGPCLYLFEREERTGEADDRDMFVQEMFEIHESRADEDGLREGAKPPDAEDLSSEE